MRRVHISPANACYLRCHERLMSLTCMRSLMLVALLAIPLVAIGKVKADVAQRLEQAAIKGDTEALAQLEGAANAGDAVAQDWLGQYYDGKPAVYDMTLPPAEDRHRVDRQLEDNDVHAAEWYRKSANQGNAEAQVLLGVLYENGFGVPKDLSLAAFWYKKAADQGSTNGLVNLKQLSDRQK